MNIDYSKYSTDDIHYKTLSDLPIGFDVKEVNESLNSCDKCEKVVRWHDQMYWRGDECAETNKILGDWYAVCDDCYIELANKGAE